MTVVAAIHHLSGVTIIADSRVSFGENQPVHDGLQKLYQVGEKVVLGFAGPLAGAHLVIEAIRENRKRSSRRAANSSIQDVERWIRRAYKTIILPEDRRNLSFILAGVESSRLRGWDESIHQKFALPYFPDCQIVALQPSQRHEGELVRSRQMIGMIGVDPKIRRSVQEVLIDQLGNLLQDPRSPSIVEAGIKALKAASTTHPFRIGGLFQCAVLDANGIAWLGYQKDNLFLQFEEGRYVQHNSQSGQKIPLLAIWEWKERYGFDEPPKDATIFEM